MGKWHQEEVAGDRYIFDSKANPVILGCPQGAPVFVIPGEHEVEAERACAAHNAEVADLERRLADVLELLEPDKRAYMNPFWYLEENANEVYRKAKAIAEGES